MLKRIAAWLAENAAGVMELVCLIGIGSGIGWQLGAGWGIAAPCAIELGLLTLRYIKSKAPNE